MLMYMCTFANDVHMHIHKYSLTYMRGHIHIFIHVMQLTCAHTYIKYIHARTHKRLIYLIVSHIRNTHTYSLTHMHVKTGAGVNVHLTDGKIVYSARVGGTDDNTVTENNWEKGPEGPVAGWEAVPEDRKKG
jgi:hypothetical protein